MHSSLVHGSVYALLAACPALQSVVLSNLAGRPGSADTRPPPSLPCLRRAVLHDMQEAVLRDYVMLLRGAPPNAALLVKNERVGHGAFAFAPALALA